MIGRGLFKVDRLAEGSFGSVYSIADERCRSASGQRYVYKEHKEEIDRERFCCQFDCNNHSNAH
jgi:hypothetical protein